jgi:hypothetical protein
MLRSPVARAECCTTGLYNTPLIFIDISMDLAQGTGKAAGMSPHEIQFSLQDYNINLIRAYHVSIFDGNDIVDT